MTSTELNKRVVGIGDIIISDKVSDTIVTYSLGSCIGVTVWDSKNKVGGMVHCLLPLSKADKERSKKEPGIFVDSGVSTLLQRMFDAGASRENLVVSAAGGAKVMDNDGVFRIGERNYGILKKVLWKNDILLDIEECRGEIARTLWLDVGTGEVKITNGGTKTS